MLMENTLQYKNKNNLKYIFDLKGSTYGRKTKGKLTPSNIRKDLDIVEFVKRGNQIMKLEQFEIELHRQLKRDVIFLKAMGMIDYSLLCAVEAIETQNQSSG